MNLHIDIETFSGTDIKLGVEKYISDPDFDILLFAYKYKDTEAGIESPTVCLDLASGDKIPAKLYEELADPSVTKKAFNAGFECACINKYLTRVNPFILEYSPIEQWKCTALHSRYLNLPHKLDDVASLWGKSKQKDGKALIKYFCCPCKPTKVNGGRLRNLPHHDIEKWERFKSYNVLDVDIESYLDDRFQKYPVPESEWKNYWMDYRINKTGIHVDTKLAANAIVVDDKYKIKMVEAAQALGIKNPNSVAQLKTAINLWASELPLFIGHMSAMTADNVRANLAIIEAYMNNPESKEHTNTLGKIKLLLEVRQALSNTSVKKYQKMLDTELYGVIYDTVYHYGAGTGRSAGRGIQPHNFARPELKEAAISTARNLLATCEADPASLKSLLRSMLIPCDKEHRFVISDFSAIEARVIAWLAQETWRLEAFKEGKDIYIASYAKMFNVPEESVTKEQRQTVGKIAELALGFGGGRGAIANFDKNGNFSDEEAENLKDTWRQASPNIVKFWYACGDAFEKALDNPHCSFVVAEGKLMHFNGNVDTTNKLVFYYDKTFLTIQLPCGRKLYYFRPGKNGRELYYLQWATTGLVEIKIYGGKIVENCLSKDTLVLTHLGWKYIVTVKPEDLLWDGLQWVSHGGIIDKGTQATINLNGVRMTEDHKILTEKGWKNASSSEGYNWATVQLPNGYTVPRIRRKKITMVMPVCMREAGNTSGIRVKKIKNKVLRLHAKAIDRLRKSGTRSIKTPRVCSMAKYEGPLYQPETSSLEKLRGSGYYSNPQMATKFRGFLGGHENRVQKGANLRKGGQFKRLLQRKLQMGNSFRAGSEQTNEYSNRYPLGQDDNFRSFEKIGYRSNNSMLPDIQQLPARKIIHSTGCTESVYDIKNAGSLNRFTVMSEVGPVIVHNCVQAVARDLLFEKMQQVTTWFSGFDDPSICLHVHDEIVLDVHKDEAEKVAKVLTEIMSTESECCKGLPLNCSTDIARYYKK